MNISKVQSGLKFKDSGILHYLQTITQNSSALIYNILFFSPGRVIMPDCISTRKSDIHVPLSCTSGTTMIFSHLVVFIGYIVELEQTV